MPMKYDIESEEFYELMQDYRHCPLELFDKVYEPYQAVKEYISTFVEKCIKDEKEDWRDNVLKLVRNDSVFPKDHPIIEFIKTGRLVIKCGEDLRTKE